MAGSFETVRSVGSVVALPGRAAVLAVSVVTDFSGPARGVTGAALADSKYFRGGDESEEGEGDEREYTRTSVHAAFSKLADLKVAPCYFVRVTLYPSISGQTPKPAAMTFIFSSIS